MSLSSAKSEPWKPQPPHPWTLIKAEPRPHPYPCLYPQPHRVALGCSVRPPGPVSNKSGFFPKSPEVIAKVCLVIIVRTPGTSPATTRLWGPCRIVVLGWGSGIPPHQAEPATATLLMSQRSINASWCLQPRTSWRGSPGLLLPPLTQVLQLPSRLLSRNGQDV